MTPIPQAEISFSHVTSYLNLLLKVGTTYSSLQFVRNISVDNGLVHTLYYFHVFPFLLQPTGRGESYFLVFSLVVAFATNRNLIILFVGKRCEALAFNLSSFSNVHDALQFTQPSSTA
jgi:hypothetical protein